MELGMAHPLNPIGLRSGVHIWSRELMDKPAGFSAGVGSYAFIYCILQLCTFLCFREAVLSMCQNNLMCSTFRRIILRPPVFPAVSAVQNNKTSEYVWNLDNGSDFLQCCSRVPREQINSELAIYTKTRGAEYHPLWSKPIMTCHKLTLWCTELHTVHWPVSFWIVSIPSWIFTCWTNVGHFQSISLESGSGRWNSGSHQDSALSVMVFETLWSPNLESMWLAPTTKAFKQ